MKRGVSSAGIGRVGSLEDFVKLAGKHGFDAVDTGGGDIQAWIDKTSVDEVKSSLKEAGVQIGSIGLPVEWRKTEDEFLAGLPALVRDAAAAAQVGCTACCTYVLPSTDFEAAHFTVLATRRLRTCAQILSAYGIRFGIEFVGPHHLRTAWKNPFIWRLQDTLDWIDAIGEANVGLLFDAYHWYTNELDTTAIRELSANQIVHVHLNDARPVPIAQVLDNDRLYPGEGVIDLVGFLRALSDIGYRGVVAQEILTPEPPLGTPEELMKKSADAYNRVFTEAGLA